MQHSIFMPVLDSRADRISVHNYHVRSDGSALQAFRFDDKVFAAVSFIFANTTDRKIRLFSCHNSAQKLS